MPRLAVDGYWRAHPIRADRLSRALARERRTEAGLGGSADEGLPATFRDPPAPYREPKFSNGPGFCCVCGQPVYRFGWHRDLWDAGPNRNAAWHTACVAAWRLWNAPSDHDRVLRRLQARRCAQTGGRLWKTAEIDHRVPLFQVWDERRDTAVARAARVLGRAQPTGHQPRRPRRQMRRRGKVSRAAPQGPRCAERGSTPFMTS